MFIVARLSQTCISDGFLNSCYCWNLKGALWNFRLDKQFSVYFECFSPGRVCILKVWSQCRANFLPKLNKTCLSMFFAIHFQSQMVCKGKIPREHMYFVLQIFLKHHFSGKKTAQQLVAFWVNKLGIWAEQIEQLKPQLDFIRSSRNKLLLEETGNLEKVEEEHELYKAQT